MSSKKTLKSVVKTLSVSTFSFRVLAITAIFAASVLFYGFTAADEFKSVNIIDGEQHYEIVTEGGTVADAIALAKIELGEKDILSHELTNEIVDGDTIYVNRSKLIYFENADKVSEFYTNESTVGDVLRTNDISVGKYDEVVPDVNTATLDGMTISVKRVNIEISEVAEEIPYTTTVVENPNEFMGYEAILQSGVNGAVTRTYKKVSKEGAGTTVMLIGEKRTEPIPEVKEVGTKEISPEDLTVLRGQTADGVLYSALPAMAQKNSKTIISGNTAITPYGKFKFKKVIDCKATAYEGGVQSNGIWAGQTATGRLPVFGVVAVDPRVIPLNSKIYVESADKGESWIYGFAVAGDTGGAIKGIRVDLCYNTLEQCYQFGRRNCRVYILE